METKLRKLGPGDQAGLVPLETLSPNTSTSAGDTQSPPTLLTIREVERLLRRSHATVYALIADGSLAAVKFGKRRTFVTNESISAFIRNLPPAVTPTMRRRMAEAGKDASSPDRAA